MLKNRNIGIKHGHITLPKHIPTMWTLLGPIQCIVQRATHLSIENATLHVKDFATVYTLHCQFFLLQ